MPSEMENKYVIFKLDKEYYGIPIANVLSIERIGVPTRIPNAPKYVKGVINLRGEVIPIVDLRCKLGMEEIDLNSSGRIIVVSVNEIVVGLIVDSSSEVLEIDKENIDKPPTDSGNQYIEYINGIGKVSNRLIILLDLIKILEY
ncbi:MAG: purine-binding chemotaxis protein CheW [Tissierellia bacterium]|nr:purine-binding chemotaxis protein CheW [Tissierellia bacterium]